MKHLKIKVTIILPMGEYYARDKAHIYYQLKELERYCGKTFKVEELMV